MPRGLAVSEILPIGKTIPRGWGSWWFRFEVISFAAKGRLRMNYNGQTAAPTGGSPKSGIQWIS
jgi:hypothetical protein